MNDYRVSEKPDEVCHECGAPIAFHHDRPEPTCECDE
jgi:hypothetical protein